MAGIWNRLTSSGIRHETSAQDAGFIRATNIMGLVVGTWLLGLVAATAGFFVSSQPELVYVNLISAILFYGTSFLNRRGHYDAATAVVGLLCLATVTFDAMHFGQETWNHLFLLASILMAFTYMKRRWMLLVNTVLALALFAFIELWFGLGNPSLMKEAMPPQAIQWIERLSIYNLIILTVGLAFSNRNITLKTQAALEKERERSESLLLNILPRSIAEQLKQNPGVIAERIPEASILFADIVGFTPFSRNLPPEDVVKMLNSVFTGFDRFARELGLEKIKTIGDAYMVAGGIPDPRPDHAEACLKLARRMLLHMAGLQDRWPGLELRIGLHSGPVVAGVIGESKFIYDLWGDSVNLASRMESHGIPGRIHLSQSFREQLGQRDLDLEERGQIEIRGQGRMTTYLVRE